MIFYVYEHYRIGEDIPFFVGKGHHRRAFTKRGRNVWWKRIVEKNGGFEVRFVQENLSEFEAFWLEVNQIAGWGRADLGEGPLVNLTDGGEGVSGWIPTKEWRDKKRKMMKNNTISKGLKQSEEQCEGKRQRMLGNTRAEGLKHSAKFKKDQSKRVSGKRNPMYGVRLTGELNHNFGKKESVERKLEKSKATKLQWKRKRKNDPEYGKGKRSPSYGRTPSEETMQKIRKPVKTPLGIFKSATEAAKAHGMKQSQISYRCGRFEGFEYLPIDKQ
jgi:hypothetical protein